MFFNSTLFLQSLLAYGLSFVFFFVTLKIFFQRSSGVFPWVSLLGAGVIRLYNPYAKLSLILDHPQYGVTRPWSESIQKILKDGIFARTLPEVQSKEVLCEALATLQVSTPYEAVIPFMTYRFGNTRFRTAFHPNMVPDYGGFQDMAGQLVKYIPVVEGPAPAPPPELPDYLKDFPIQLLMGPSWKDIAIRTFHEQMAPVYACVTFLSEHFIIIYTTSLLIFIVCYIVYKIISR